MTSRNNRGKWDLPGGKVDKGESFDQALLREVAEETGLAISLERVAGATQADLPEQKVAYIIMEGQVMSGALRLSEEHDDYEWVVRRNLPDMDLCPSFRKFAEMYSRISPTQDGAP